MASGSESADLRLRAGVLTGEAAVTIGAEGQGMVTGDLVNTASRIQAAAAPGTVLVGDSTHRATQAAIAYAAAGERDLKGKAEPVPVGTRCESSPTAAERGAPSASSLPSWAASAS